MFSWKFSTAFAKDFSHLPESDADKVVDFTFLYETAGLSDFSMYPGKITPSWYGSSISPEDYAYAKGHHLWHYHVGIPTYTQAHSKFKTSDWVLHFQWPNKSNEIALVDLYSHYTSAGDFYLPPKSYLEWVYSPE